MMMETLSPQEENVIKDIRSLFRLKYNKITLQLKMQEITLDWRKKLKQLKIEHSEILRIFLKMKKKIIIQK